MEVDDGDSFGCGDAAGAVPDPRRERMASAIRAGSHNPKSKALATQYSNSGQGSATVLVAPGAQLGMWGENR